jgi:hypothetical protein
MFEYFEHEVLVTANHKNHVLLRQMGLKLGRDYRSGFGAVKAGRPDCLKLFFKDKDKALMYKLRAI